MSTSQVVLSATLLVSCAFAAPAFAKPPTHEEAMKQTPPDRQDQPEVIVRNVVKNEKYSDFVWDAKYGTPDNRKTINEKTTKSNFLQSKKSKFLTQPKSQKNAKKEGK